MKNKKSQKYGLFQVILVIMLLLAVYSTIPDNTNTFNPNEQNVLILGDSISNGYSLIIAEKVPFSLNIIIHKHNKYSFLSFDYKANSLKNFGHLLIRKMSILAADHGKPINCRGTVFAKNNIESWIDDKFYDVIHMNFGLHDIVLINQDEYTKNIEQLIIIAKSHTNKLIIATTTPVDCEHKNRTIRLFNQSLRSLAKTYDLPINDLHAVSINHSLSRIDGTHYSKTGYAILAEETTSLLLDNLPP